MSIDKSQTVLLNLLSNALFQKPFLLEENIDWGKVLSESIYQSVAGLAFSALPREDISEKVYKEWERRTNVELLINSNIGYAHTLVNDLLSGSEISYVILKGCVSAFYYDFPMLRTMGDVDFLVKSSDFEKTGVLLDKNKFIYSNIVHEYEKTYTKDGVVFELHNKINGVPGGKIGAIIDGYFEDIFEKATFVDSDFARYYSPSDFHHGLIMLLHVARHMITGGIGLRHFCDWAVFVEKMGEGFPAIFEKKLKRVGLWRFAQVLTQSCVVYLGCSPKLWTGDINPKLLDDLINDVFAGGNFGKKDKKRRDEAKFITSRKKGGVNDDSNVKQGILSLNEIVRKHWRIAEKIPVIYPFGWLFFGTRYTLRAMLGKRKRININKLADGAEKRKEIYRQLRLFEK